MYTTDKERKEEKFQTMKKRNGSGDDEKNVHFSKKKKHFVFFPSHSFSPSSNFDREEEYKNMLIKSLVLILLMTQFRGNKKKVKRIKKRRADCCRLHENSYKGRIQCEQIIQAIRLMNFRSFL